MERSGSGAGDGAASASGLARLFAVAAFFLGGPIAVGVQREGERAVTQPPGHLHEAGIGREVHDRP